MPLPSASSILDLNRALTRVLQAADTVKQRSLTLSAQSSAGSISSGQILDYATMLADKKLDIQAAIAMAGLNAYAQSLLGMPALDVVAEANTCISAIDAVTAWILANFPANGGGFLAAVSFAPDNSGRTVFRTFSTAAMSGFRSQLDALVATIS